MRVPVGSAATALIIALGASSAPALTPEEAWAAFQKSVTAGGQTLEVGSTERVGDTLTITGVTMTFAIPDGTGFTSTLPTLGFKDAGGGVVEVIYPANFDAQLTLPDAEPDAPKTIDLAIVYDGLAMTAQGDAARPAYDFAARSATAMVREMKDQTGKVMDVTAVLSMTDATGSYAMPLVEGDLISGDSALAVKTIAVSFEGRDASGFSLSGTVAINDVALNGKTTMLDPAQLPVSVSAMLAAGMLVDTTFSTGTVGLSITAEAGAEGGGETGGFDATFASTSAAVFLDKSRIDYGFSVLGAKMVARGNTMPVPEVATAFAEASLAFSMPVAVSDQPQPFTTLVKFIDFTLTEDVWALFDPGAQLPRDPVSFILDLKGSGAWTVDIMDPAAMVEQGPELPARIFALDLSQYLTRFAGAEITGEGALTFNNDDLETFYGFPAPTGQLTFTLNGVNALIDALVAIGIVPEEEVMGARFFLSAFARPGAGPDQLISEFKFQDGKMTINGQPF